MIASHILLPPSTGVRALPLAPQDVVGRPQNQATLADGRHASHTDRLPFGSAR